MNSFLFAWNPKKWIWTNLDEQIRELRSKRAVCDTWSCASHRSVTVGDRAFLIRLGVEPKGIMASGWVRSAPFLAEHWNGSGQLQYKVSLEFDVLVNPVYEPILSLEFLRNSIRKYQCWTPQSSCIAVNEEIAEDLELLWSQFISSNEFH